MAERAHNDIGPAAGIRRGSDPDEIIAQIQGLLRQLRNVGGDGSGAEDRGMILRLAREAYQARRKRDKIFGPRLFAEPSWDILLDLFIARLEGREVSVSSACMATPAPATTALRHISHLVQLGFLTRRPSATDARVSYLELSELAVCELTRVFSK
ncbi:MAG: hypothetical protein JOZ90_17075 [Alphaproteobacteria bacterium]|nr:hypothetical protein [Alphaproteobacteria bacterium]MBV9371474.1 hypothetical protein [Alphaproteobacteria bacterium]MBV9902784.1 hypothetical protein [Alphaproteobacteria bacterium]